MTQLRHNFIQNLELKGFSPRTVRNYVQVVAKLSNYYNCSPLELSKQQIKDYSHHQIKNKLLTPRSINLHIGALKTFYNFMLPDFHERTINISEVLSKSEVATPPMSR